MFITIFFSSVSGIKFFKAFYIQNLTEMTTGSQKLSLKYYLKTISKSFDGYGLISII